MPAQQHQLLDFLQTQQEAFQSRSRLASLYSDFRFQRNTNPDGYQANSTAWLRALTHAARAGLVPPQVGHEPDRLNLHTGEELVSALQTSDFGRPLALGAVLHDAITNQELIPLREFLDTQHSIYARTWIPTLRQIVTWSLKQIGAAGGQAAGDRLVKGDFVITANVEYAAKAVVDQMLSTSTSNISRIYSKELFNTTFAPVLGINAFSEHDLSALLKHLARDREAIAYSTTSGTIKFKAPSETHPAPITDEDISIASLKSLIASLELQTTQLTVRVSELGHKARDAVAGKQMIAAKTALRQKKSADTKLQQRTATLAQLEDVYVQIERAADQVEIVKALAASGQTLKRLNQQTGGVEKVQDVMDSLREDMASVDEIGQAINEVSAGEVDEGEVEDELEALEKVEKEKRKKVEQKEREEKEVAEKAARESRDAAEAEKTRQRLAELDAPDQAKSAESSNGETTRPIDQREAMIAQET